jgi:hypothetical protein
MWRTVYAIEATVHAPTWEGVYGEIKKVLKPGGIVSNCLLRLEVFLIVPLVRCLRMVHD